MTNNYTNKEKMFLKRVGAKVREVRKKKGFSQEAFALEVGLDRTYMGGVERGQRNVALLNLKKIAAGLKVPMGKLLD